MDLRCLRSKVAAMSVLFACTVNMAEIIVIPSRGGGCAQAECVRVLKGLALPRATHSGKIALSGSRHLRSTLAAAPILFAHAALTVAKNHTSATPNPFHTKA